MKKIIYAIVAVLILTGVAFALSNTNLFKGQVVTGPDTSGLPGSGSGDIGVSIPDELTESGTTTTGAGMSDNGETATGSTATGSTATGGTGNGTPTAPTGGGTTSGGGSSLSIYLLVYVDAEDGEDITDLTMGDFEITTTSGSDAHSEFSFSKSSNKYTFTSDSDFEDSYNVKVNADGYVSEEKEVQSNESDYDAPSAMIFSLKYAQAIIVNDTDGNPITDLEVYTGPDYETECHYFSTGGAYDNEYVCATPINSDKNYSVGGAGYITTLYEFANAPRSSHDDSQRVKGWNGDFQLTSDQYAYTITVTDSETGSVIEDASVAFYVGTQSTTDTCDYVSNGMYWCATSSLSDGSNIVYKVEKTDYETASGAFDVRSSKTADGVNMTVALVSTTAAGDDDDDDDDDTTCPDGETYDADLGACVENTASDYDEDGLSDDDEVEVYGTDFKDPDTDGDGLTDGEEVLTYGTDPLDVDSDSDGMDDYWELYYGLDPLTDDADADPDEDGYTNLEEYDNDTNPIVADSASDSCDEGYTYDADSETCIANTSDTDTDGDGLTDEQEAILGTDPTLTDTDGDGYSDYEEVANYKTDPLDETDYPGSDGNDILGSSSYSCSDPFVDTKDHWAKDLICRLYQVGIVKGRSSTLFEPNDYVTRAEWIKMLVLSAGYDESQASGKSEDFTDVTSTDWYYPYMVIAEYLDVARVREGSYFNPNTPITRGDAVLYAVRMAGETLYGWDANDITFSDLSTSDYFTYAVLIANNAVVDVPEEGPTPVIEGYEDGTFKPYSYITRAEAAAVALRAILAWF